MFDALPESDLDFHSGNESETELSFVQVDTNTEKKRANRNSDSLQQQQKQARDSSIELQAAARAYYNNSRTKKPSLFQQQQHLPIEDGDSYGPADGDKLSDDDAARF